MAKFKVIISEPETGKSRSVELEGTKAVPLVGRKMREIIDGSVVGMAGKNLQITGGSDKDGFPMRNDVHGGVRISIIVAGGTGFQPRRKGERRRKTIRGNVITEDTVQINMKTIEKTKEETKKKKINDNMT